MPKNLADYFNDSDRLKITDEIARHLLKFRDNRNKPKEEHFGSVDVQYDLSKGVMQGTDANTFLSFDIEEGNILHDFFKAMYADEIEEEDETIEKLRMFIGQVCKDLNSSYSVTLRDVVRDAALPGSEEWITPLNTVEIFMIDLVDYSAVDEDDKYTIKIGKYPNKYVNMKAIFEKIAEIKEKDPGKTSEQIVQERKEAGDALFDGVHSVVRGDKYLWDVSISIYADYSVSDTFVAHQSTPER